MKEELNIPNIIKEFHLEKFAYNVNQGKLKIDVLNNIYNDYCNTQELFRDESKKITSNFNNLSKIIHSLRSRIKEPNHLIAKIIRNFDRNAEKYKNICKDNYKNIITDLIGIRIIILGKEDWKKVHDFLKNFFLNDNRFYLTKENGYTCNENPHKCLVEQPVIYTAGERENSDLYTEYKDVFEIKSSMEGYRSIHYVGRFENFICEVQVRTIFDEGWIEFDHEIKYPKYTENKIKGDFLWLMSNMSKTSQDMISFYRKYPKSFILGKEQRKEPIVKSKKGIDESITSSEEIQEFADRIKQFIYQH